MFRNQKFSHSEPKVARRGFLPRSFETRIMGARGAALVEYAMLVSTFCAVLMSVAPATVGGANAKFNQVRNALTRAQYSQTIITNPTAHPISPLDGHLQGGGTDGTVASCDQPGQVWNPASHRCEDSE